MSGHDPTRVTVSPRTPMVVVCWPGAVPVLVLGDDAVSLRIDTGALADSGRVALGRALIAAGHQICPDSSLYACEEWPSVATGGASAYVGEGVSQVPREVTYDS